MLKLNPVIQNRYSPRAIDDKIVTKEMIMLLFEAARWAPSAMNEQPWKYFWVHRDNKNKFEEVMNLLTGINPEWAKNAQAIIISVARKKYEYNNKQNRNALHDTGAANFSIALQAAEMGLQVRQMGGYDREKAAAYFKLDNEKYELATFIAVGFPGEPEQLPEELRIRELQPRVRKEIYEFTSELTD
ncbi:MAG: nitroreductase family protein [Draconibacterium sp.]